MSVTQYIGARYVPFFAEPLAWDITKQYEPLTIVYYQGNSYTSKQAVPANIDIANEDFWAITGNYNAQIEQYRQEVTTYDNRITANTTSNTNQDAQLAGTSNSGLKTLIDANTNSNTNQDAQLAGTANSGLKTLIDTNTSNITINASDIGTLEGQIAGTSNSGLKTLIDSNTTAINNLSSEVALNNVYSGKKSIGFGDSNMKGVSTGTSESDCAYHQICDFLGCTYDNRGVNGARIMTSYTGSEGTVLGQINAASADSDVRLVVIIGGINDYHYETYNYWTFSSSINATLDAAINKFTNADICLIWDQGKQRPGSRMLRYQECIQRKANYSRTRKIVCVPTFDISFGGNSYYASQNHWNAAACSMVAQRACAYLVGGSPIRGLVFRESVNPKEVTGAHAVVEATPILDSCSIIQHADVFLSANMRYNDSATIPSFRTLFELPMGFTQNLGSSDKYFYGGVVNRSNTFTYNARQFTNNWESVTDNPIVTIRNVGDWAWPNADAGFEFTQTLIPWS